MKIKRLFSTNQLTIVFGVLALLAFFSVLYYQNTGLKLHFFHESAYPLLYAESNLQTSSLYDSSFLSREISPISWPVFGSLVLLLTGGGVTLTAHVIYVMGFTIAFLLVGYFYVRVMRFRALSSWIFIALLFTTFTFAPTRYGLLDQVWVWPMNSYGVQDLFTLFCAILIHNFMAEKNKTETNRSIARFHLAMVLVAFGVLGFNGIRGLLMVGGSLIVGILADYFVQNRSRWASNLSYLFFPIALILVSGIGWVTTKLFFSGVPQPFQTNHMISTLAEKEDLGDRISGFFWGWLRLFGAIPVVGQSLFSIENLFFVTKLILALALFVLIVVKITKVHHSKHEIERILSYRLGFIILVTFSAAILTDTAGTERYLIPIYFGALFLVPFWVDKLLLRKKNGVIFLASLVLIPIIVISLYNLTRFSMDDYKTTSHFKLAQYLKEEGLSFGFFVDWRSDALVVNQFSEGSVRVQPLDIENNRFVQHIHSNSELFKSRTNEDFFIMMPLGGMEPTSLGSPLVSKSIETLYWGEWKISIFKSTDFSSVIDRR